MFCRKCGKQLEGELTICPECAAADNRSTEQPVQVPVKKVVVRTVEAPAQEQLSNVEAPVQESAPSIEQILGDAEPQVAEPATQAAEFTLGTVEQEAPKKSKGLLIALIAGGIVAVAALALVFFWDSLFGKSFGTPQEQLAGIQEQQLNSIAQSIGDYCDTYLTSAQGDQSGEHIEMTMTLGDTIMETLNATGEDLSWLRSISLLADGYTDGDNMQYFLQLGLSGQNIISVDAIMEGGNLCFAIPELSNRYIIAPEDMLESFNELMASSQATESIYAQLLPEADVLESMILRYGQIFIDSTTNVTSEKQRVVLGEHEQELTVLTARITEEDLYNTLIAMAQEIQNDTDIEKWLDDVSQSMGGEDIYDMLVSELDSMLAEVDNAQDSFSGGNYMDLIYYVDDDNQVVGFSFNVSTDGEPMDMPLNYITVTDSNGFSFQAEFATLLITGSGTEKDGAVNGEYRVLAEGEEYFIVTVRNAESDDQGNVSGKLRIQLGDAIKDELKSDPSMSILAATPPVIEVKYDISPDKVDMTLSFTMLGTDIMSFDISVEKLPGKDISTPVNAFTDDQLDEWAATASFDEVKNNLAKAGMPQEMIRELLAEFAG